MRDKWAEANPDQPKPWKEPSKVEHKVIQNFIETESPDLNMSAPKLRDAFRKKRGKESCPSLSIFESTLYDLKKKQLENNPTLSNLSRPRRKNVMVKPEALQEFIKAKPSGLSLSPSTLRDVFMNERGEELCPSQSVFKRALKKLRDKQVEEN